MNKPSHKITDLYGPIIDAVPDMLVLFDRDAAILDIHHPKPELASDNAESLIGRSVTEEAVKNQIGVNPDDLDMVFRTHEPRQFCFRRKAEDGKTGFYEIFLSYLKTGQVLADIRTIHEEYIAQMESKHLHYFFADVLDNIAVPVTVKSMETGKYVYWSQKAELFGRTAGEMVGATEELYMTPEQAHAVQQTDLRLVEGKEKQYQGIERYRVNDGKEHSFIVTRTPFTFGRERLILCSALDVSELKETQISLLQTKDELARKNMILSSVLSLAKVIPWSCDLVNNTFYCDYEAYHPDNAAGPDEEGRYVIPMETYFAGIHPDYRQEAIRMIEELSEGKREEFHQIYLSHWFNEQQWEWIQVQSSIARRGPDGRPVALIGSAQRVTDQKQTEIALRKATEELDLKNVMLSSVLSIAQVLPWSGDLRAGTFNCDYEAYHPENAEGPDENGNYVLSFDEFFSRIHPDYRTHAIDQFADLLERRTAEFHEVYPIHWYNDREYEWVETQSSIPQFTPEGEPLQVVGSARVVTAQKRMEESLRKAKEEAERSNTLKSAFLANMSHEIRTPLNAIVGFSELLAQTDDPEEKKEYLDIIQNSNALLLQLIGDILDLSKIEAGTLEFVFAEHDLNALMEELEQTTRVKSTNPSVEVACTHQVPGCTIHTDRGRLLQVLHNFINNAIKFTHEGHIHFGFRKHHDGRWYFYVEDTGCGIASNLVNNVFNRFVKLDAKVKGTGLGLAISKSIIERLGGEIGVYSAEGQGSTFWFLLPAGSIITAAPIPESEEPTPQPFLEVSNEPTLLIAEDDPANYRLFEVMLKKSYKLLHAWNGREAIEMFKEHRPCMILMDIKMPEVDGYEATAAIRKLSPDIPILAVTAFAYPEDMRRILASGFNGCLPKPVDANQLKAKISELNCGKK